MAKKSVLWILFLLLALDQCYGQDKSSGEHTSTLVEQLGTENLQTVSQTQILLPEVESNSVYIQQIGSNNSSLVNIRATNSQFDLIQNGNANSVRIKAIGETLKHTLTQNGNNNLLLEYGNTPNLDLERNIIQNGSNQGVFIYGSNALTDKIFLNLQGSSKTITIRNFN
ncbi:hypothetical protein [Maribacter sp. 2307UL18-2]|uniref:hypothetical protein n=1 Tax=Maribacter sp. 2307UL18-2 TaxID=3386274 RepID=UPI0039BC3948